MKTLKKTIAIFLVMLTIFTTLSAVMPVLASFELVTAGNVTSGNVPETEAEPTEELEILSEIIEKREENAKHFLMSDGSFMVAQYPTAVHYQNDSEEWVDYNNNVKDTQATTEQVELFGTDELYSTSNLLENVVFAEKSNSNTLVSYEAKDYPISFNYQSAKKSNIKIIENETELTGNDAFLTLPDITQEVLYENVFDGVDLQYIVSPDNLKENIIIKNKSAQNSFTVNYNIGELSAQVVDDKTINLMSGSEVIYTISAPYMYDANGEKSEGITLTVDKNKNGKLRVDITVDSQWLQAENRAYPVVVDPTIETKTDRDAIDSVMIAKSCGNTNYSAQSEMVVGYEGSEYGQCRVLVKFTLPALNKGDIIVDARLNLFNTTLEYYYSDTADMQVNAHMLTGEWSLTGVTWNNQPTYDSIVADYNIFKKGTGYNWRYFNITQIAKEWYNDPTSNNGILLKSSTEVADKNINGVKAKLYSEKYNSVENHYPSLSLTYRNNKGIEDFWSYTTLSAGSAGTAYINDYTGNLVFIHGDVATTGELMPVSLEHVYNGYMADKNASTYPHSGRGNKLSLQQTVKASGIADYPYIYEDGDGTQHYFYKKTENGTTKYIDEDGLNLELKIVSGGGYTITDKSDNVMTFNTSGLLTQIADAEGRKATLTYATEINTAENEKPFLKTITDGAGHKITLTYNTGANGGSNCQLKSITGPDGKTLTYNTSDGKRSKVTYPDGTYSTYTYDSDGALLTAKSSDGYKLTFTYGTDGAKRVTSVTESVGDSLGQKIVFSRNKVNQTVIETAGDDAVFGNSDDLITTYQFDNFGRTVSTKMKLRDGTSLGAEKYNYTGGSEGGGTDIGKRNRISSSAAMGKNINNLLINHNFENTDDWASTYWLNSSYNSYGTAEITNAYKYNGEKSVKITVNDLSSVTVDGGMAMHQAAGICSSPGTYTFSAYIKTNGVTVREGAERGGACLAVRITDENGDYIRQYSEMLTDTTDTSLDNGWQRIHFTFEVPDGAALCRVYPLLYNAKGTAYFDCAQLEKNSTVNTYNLLQNASFENGTENWSVNNCGDGEGISTAINNGGSKSFKFIGNAGTEKYIRQTVYVSGSEKDTYILSGYVRAFAVPLDMEAGRRMDISVKINYEGGTSKIKRPTIFNSAVPGSWQYASGVFNLSDEDDSTTKTPESIIVYCGYRKQANACYFDDISLVKEPAPTYTYDEDGNLISASENAEKNTNLSYDANDNLKSFTDERNAQYEYKYAETGNKHRLLSATNKASGVKYAYSYYGSGTGNNLKAQEIVSGSGNYIIRTSTVYTDAENGIASGAYVRRESNQHGYSTYYNYNKQSGLLMSVTDAEDNRTEYDYDENNGNITSVTAGGKTVGYTYDSSKTKLTQITHNGFNYGFTYDAFGNILSTKVGSQPLMTNEYQANNGKLTKSTYGNGDYKEYTYNDYGQTVRINENNKNAFYWRYNNTGYPYMHTDYNSGRVYYYTYDSLGRVIREFEKTYGEEEYRFGSQFTYDLSNNLTKLTNSADGLAVTTKYYFDAANRPTKSYLNPYVDHQYVYDTLGRLNYTNLNFKNDAQVKIDYTYANAANRSAEDVTYITSQISKEEIGDRGYEYTYDKVGNITEIKEKSASGTYATKVTYTYDALGQLKRENNVDLNKTIVYNYDSGGNVVSKVEYPYTTGTVGTATKTVSYGYDSAWKDKLVSIVTGVNSEETTQNITYDEIGNPETYRNGMTFTWQGRQMKTANLNGTAVTYKYNADGLRTYKKVGSTVHEYEYSGDKLFYEKRGDIKFYYRYDVNGNLMSITRLEADGDKFTLYAVCNSRGDVEELRKENGTLYARYVYDSWGNVLYIYSGTGTTEITDTDNLAIQNPFRYRGYYFDAESGLYYLQSRYYDPVTGRFVNADSLVDTSDVLGFNMYAYCGNNPVVREDYSGCCYGYANDPNLDSRSSGVKYGYNCGRYGYHVRNPKNTKENKGTTKGLAKTMVDAFSVKVGAGFGFGASAEAGAVGVNAYIKGNPINVVITFDDEERGMFYTFDAELSVETPIIEMYTRESYKYKFWTQEDLSEGYDCDVKFKDSYSLSFSLYFFVGAEVEISYNFRSVYDYILSM